MFNRIENLRRHILSVHDGVKSHECDFCGKAFSEAGKLKKHINNVHYGLKNHMCGYCGNAFSDSGKLRLHIKTVHEGQNNDTFTSNETVIKSEPNDVMDS